MYLKFNPCVCLLPFSVFYYATYHSSLTFSGSSSFEQKIRGVPPPLIFFASSARSLFCENAFLSAQCQKPIRYGYACVFNRSKQDLSVRMRADKANTAALSECRGDAFGKYFFNGFFRPRVDFSVFRRGGKIRAYCTVLRYNCCGPFFRDCRTNRRGPPFLLLG